MRFTDGFWQLREGVSALYAREAHDIDVRDDALVVSAPTKVIETRGDTLNRPVLTVTLTAPLAGIIGVLIEHHIGGLPHEGFDLPGIGDDSASPTIVIDATGGAITSGDLTARVRHGAGWSLSFESGGHVLASSDESSIAMIDVDPSVALDGQLEDQLRRHRGGGAQRYMHQQLSLGVGELVYGLGERFGPLVKNGQSIETWNADGGTSSEQAYKNVPFYVTNRGYGVLVDHPGHVSFEVGSENVERVQFAVAGERLQYYVIAGTGQREVLERYTALTGRPALPPAWSFGTWLSTSFTTDYDEKTVTGFIDGFAERDLPLSVFHFDCFWMREFNWCDFEWDPRVFPDPEGMLHRLHSRGLKVSVWVNPYIGQRSPLFEEARSAGHLLRRRDGTVWQWDMWQAGMAIVDFTNPDARRWYQEKLRRLTAQGVDTFKTDFGERVPLDVVWHDGSAPEGMHNRFAQLYNEAVFEVLQERGEGDAVVFARSATVGGHRFPVHWGGDSASTFVSMAETLRGGLSLAFGAFGFWSHDIGGFEGTPDPAVFKRWTAFGFLSSHSRFHGSRSYRVPWAFDDEAVEVTRVFSQLKMRLMPYLYAAGKESARSGVPVMRPMPLAFPDDPAAAYLDRQYMLGADLLVAPVFTADGDVEFYLPAGGWTHLLTGERVTGGGWRRERHGFTSLPLYVRDGAVLPLSAHADRPDADWLKGLELRIFGDPDDATIVVDNPAGDSAEYSVVKDETGYSASTQSSDAFSIAIATGPATAASHGKARITR
ncbi:alpha-xylosidase [Microbacterium sp. APC 3901]|uniref:alpha-xylosidase n=1 Tax=Microbacterium sp. APC 3901 TaxID=3035192 RepID=UPI0025B34018|nr:alpha-xylosidase [Microbacterium sp. APC 3901]MDN3443086.1 alpha-xylosidase [Microbacterium sp. APC 3901]